MKPRTAIIILADDLTGAAEIGAAARSRGLDAVVATGTTRGAIHGEALVHDTDTRLLQPADAARKIVSIAARCGIAKAARAGTLVLKKTDSVLRGPIVAELDTLSAISGHSRVLLVAGNPRLGRIVRDGHLYVHGQPIQETSFGRDPHHPARSSSVIDLLGPVRRGEIHVRKPGEPLPPFGLIVGEAASLDDLAFWASCVTDDMLVAGSSVFLEAVLEARGHRRGAPGPATQTDGPLLVASGTTADTTRTVLATSAVRIHCCVMPEICALPSSDATPGAVQAWIATIEAAIQHDGRAVALPPEALITEPSASSRLRATFASAIEALHQRAAFRHLVIEGGSTAATVLHLLHWNVLDVVTEVAPGVATLQPRQAPGFFVTLKPGSYPWPDAWWQSLMSDRPTSP